MLCIGVLGLFSDYSGRAVLVFVGSGVISPLYKTCSLRSHEVILVFVSVTCIFHVMAFRLYKEKRVFGRIERLSILLGRLVCVYGEVGFLPEDLARGIARVFYVNILGTGHWKIFPG